MRLDDLDPSRNVDDLGSSGGGMRGFGGGGGGLGSLLFAVLPMLLGRRIGCWAVAIIVVVGYYLLSSGGMNLSGPTSAPQEASQQGGTGNVACDTKDELFACRVLKSTEDTWGKTFQNYRPAKLHFYSRENQSGCGAAQSAMGPFYCPTDNGVYLDTSFFAQMKQDMGAGGDFAQAYVIAHEVGHHIQTLDGTADKVRQAQSRASQAQSNALQVAMELQADCYAGVWAAKNADRMEPGDMEEGMTAANAIGDDTLMKNAGQRPVESMFTHGTSAQRMGWLRKGLQTGDPKACNTSAG